MKRRTPEPRWPTVRRHTLDVTSLEVGLAFDCVVETMPIEAQLADGTPIGNRQRITRATIRMKNTRP